jgi:hypothetical protein
MSNNSSPFIPPSAPQWPKEENPRQAVPHKVDFLSFTHPALRSDSYHTKGITAYFSSTPFSVYSAILVKVGPNPSPTSVQGPSIYLPVKFRYEERLWDYPLIRTSFKRSNSPVLING